MAPQATFVEDVIAGREGLLTVEDVWRFVPHATTPRLRLILARPQAGRCAAAELYVRGTAAACESDLPSAIALLRRARAAARSTLERAFISDSLSVRYLDRHDFARFVESLAFERDGLPPRIAICLQSLDALAADARGSVSGSRRTARAAMRAATELGDPLVRQRVASRCAHAAYRTGDYAAAREWALEAARLAEAHDAPIGAAHAYDIAASLAMGLDTDGEFAASLCERIVRNAEAGERWSMLRVGLARSALVAAERFDEHGFRVFRQRLLREPSHEQLRENFGLLAAEILGLGWKGKFGTADAALTAYAASPRIDQERAFIEAFRSMIAVARWDIEEARRRAHDALRQTAGRPAGELFHQRLARVFARLIAAATCYAIGDRIRAERALSATFDPEQRFRTLLSASTIDLDACPDLFRGYAQFINVAVATGHAMRPAHGLTTVELELLRALPGGQTVADLAAGLGKSKHTVARQLESIYAKLGVHNRAHAVEQARVLGVL